MSLGLAPVVVRSLLTTLRALAADGTAIVLVEQHVQLALEAADHAVILSHGKVVLAGSADELRDADLRAAYLGAKADT
jgi:branched-chain amino acid transport system ATP-binding protein